MLLSLDTRQVGRVTVVRCAGKIVAGSESEWLHSHLNKLLLDRRSILLDMGEVAFIDSSGLGMMVRALANTKQVRGELKLCNVPQPVKKVLDITSLSKMFELHETEEMALEAFYRPAVKAQAPVQTGRSILCFGANLDVLAYLREVLRNAGYEVQAASLAGDVRVLMRVSKVDLLLVCADKRGALAASPALRDACARVAVLELDGEFSRRCAGEAGAELLGKVEAGINSKLS